MLFGVQGEFNHPLKEFVRLQPGEIVTNQFFADQAALEIPWYQIRNPGIFGDVVD
jgi:hypothetical protein